MRAPIPVAVYGRATRKAPSYAVLLVSLALSVIVGLALAHDHPELAVAAAGCLIGLAVIGELSVVAWCGLLLVTTVAMRGVVTVLSLPESLNFLHYPVTIAMAIAALQRPRREASRVAEVWMAGLLIITLASLVANLSHPIRALVFLLIVAEPIVVMWALSRLGMSPQDRKMVGLIVIGLAIAQLPIVTIQAARFGFGDFVQGTLTGHNAGHHVLGGLFALLLLVTTAAISGRRLGVIVGVAAGACCLFVMVATGSMAITVLTAALVPAVPLLAAMSGGSVASRPPLRVGPTLLAGLAIGATALVVAEVLVPSIYQRVGSIASPERSYELALLEERLDDPGTMAFGAGPGTTASRASLLLIGAEATGSPLAVLGLEPTPEALEIAGSTRSEYGGSAESAQSTALAIIGDLGLIGLIGTALLLRGMWRALGRSLHWLGPAARAALALTAVLVFVDNWFEYPEFAVPLAILVGSALNAREMTYDGDVARR